MRTCIFFLNERMTVLLLCVHPLRQHILSSYLNVYFVCVFVGTNVRDMEAQVTSPSGVTEMCQINELDDCHYRYKHPLYIHRSLWSSCWNYTGVIFMTRVNS